MGCLVSRSLDPATLATSDLAMPSVSRPRPPCPRQRPRQRPHSRPRRRPRRMLSFSIAIMAVLLALLVVPAITLTPSPALAARGSVEVLVDADNNFNTAPVREFAGETRYETSLAAAQQYIDTARAAGTPATTAIIASGESLIDAASAAGLARAANAPVLLTPSDQLFVPAAHLIERSGITRVLIVGGAAAVSQQVAATLATVPGVASVERIGGRNRYDTAALIAVAMNAQGQYCNSGLKSALLVTGDTELLTDVTVAGPMSYAAGIPILLAATNAVPAETIAVLQALGIQHVVTVGGATFPADVQNAIGIEQVTTVAGANQFATAVEMLRQMETCLGDAFSSNTIALISETALPDGISAAPMLGQGLLQNGQTTPALLVSSNAIPPETKDYLFATPRAIEVTTIGGVNAVSAAVARVAVAAANGENVIIPTPGNFVPGDPQDCRLPGTNDPAHSIDGHVHDGVTVGFPLPPWAPDTLDTLDIAVLFVDFPDAPATHSTFVEGEEQLREAERYLETASYGQMDVQFHPLHTWLRTPFSWRRYATRSAIGSQTLAVNDMGREAVALARSLVDFTFDYETVMVVTPSTYFGGGVANVLPDAVPENPSLRLFTVTNSQPHPRRGSATQEWWKVAAHELAHNLGLSDLYSYDASIREQPSFEPRGKSWTAFEVGLMGLTGFLLVDDSNTDFQTRTSLPRGFVIDSPERIDSRMEPAEMLAWSRWQLDWLREREVACLTQDVFDSTVNLTPIANPDGIAMAMIPTSNTSGIVIESRRLLGYDTNRRFSYPCCSGGDAVVNEVNLVEEGLLIYRVDSPRDSGQLPLSLFFRDANRVGELDRYPILTLGDTARETLPDGTRLEITLESDDGFSHTVRIKRS